MLFHTDAVQAAAHLPIDVQAMNIDMLSLSAHKFHGPKGVGVLYARNGIRLINVIEGGAQERGKRAGTINVPGIAALAAALEDGIEHMEENNAKTIALRDRLIKGLSDIPYSQLNGDPVKRLPGNVNYSFEGVEGESLLLALDMYGIECSSGSACTSESLDPSHVLIGMGVPIEAAHGSLRFSLNEENTEEQVDYIIEKVHFEQPRNVGEIENADGVGEVGNPTCGDIMRIYLKIDNDIITDVKFKTFGCGSAIASSSMATELIKGKSIKEALELSNKAVVEALDGIPSRKIHCSVLAEEAIKAALVDYYEKNGLELPPEIKDFEPSEEE